MNPDNQNTAGIEAGLQSIATALLGQAGSYKITGFYPLFYSQPAFSGTVGNSYTASSSLPRAVEPGEVCMLIPVGGRWCTPEYKSQTTTTFTFDNHCNVSSAGVYSRWGAIYAMPL